MVVTVPRVTRNYFSQPLGLSIFRVEVKGGEVTQSLLTSQQHLVFLLCFDGHLYGRES